MIKYKSLQQLKNDAQKVFNEYIRLRDNNKPCVSCGEFKVLQAGHFYPVGSYDGLRFNEDNCFGECEQCNCFESNHLDNYKKMLEKRLTITETKDLHNTAKKYKKYGYKFSKSELKKIIKKYKIEILIRKNEQI